MFEKLIGNNNIKEILSNIVEPSHAYMFVGKEGIGKLLYAKEFAYKWLCIGNNKPCGFCKPCIQFADNNNMDFEVIEPLDGSVKVEQIRQLIKKTYEKPIESNKKIYIINEADTMTVSAQNALLKVLEEPPIYVMIILIGKNEYSFLNTIKSRCIKIKFNDLSKDELKTYLNENNKEVSDDLLELYQGSIGNAEKLGENLNDFLEIKKVLVNLENVNDIDIFKKFNNLITKENYKEMLEYMNVIFFKLKDKNIKYLSVIERIDFALNRLKSNCNFEMTIDELVFSIIDILK